MMVEIPEKGLWKGLAVVCFSHLLNLLDNALNLMYIAVENLSARSVVKWFCCHLKVRFIQFIGTCTHPANCFGHEN